MMLRHMIFVMRDSLYNTKIQNLFSECLNQTEGREEKLSHTSVPLMDLT